MGEHAFLAIPRSTYLESLLDYQSTCVTFKKTFINADKRQAQANRDSTTETDRGKRTHTDAWIERHTDADTVHLWTVR